MRFLQHCRSSSWYLPRLPADVLLLFLCRKFHNVVSPPLGIDRLAHLNLVLLIVVYCFVRISPVREAVTTAFCIVQNVGLRNRQCSWLDCGSSSKSVSSPRCSGIHLYRSLKKWSVPFHIAVVFMSCQIVCFKISSINRLNSLNRKSIKSFRASFVQFVVESTEHGHIAKLRYVSPCTEDVAPPRSICIVAPLSCFFSCHVGGIKGVNNQRMKPRTG